MAARKKATPAHAKQVMRKIKRLASPYPLLTAQARLDEIAELATMKVDTKPVKFRSNREEPPSQASSDVSAEEG